jgi:hypothetical protein
MVDVVWTTHLAATLMLTGLIWVVQVVHYPLFAFVGRESFAEYERRHQAAITWLVLPGMLVEAGSGLFLLWLLPAGEIWNCLVASAVLLAVIWLSTAFLQMPLHDRLSRGFSPMLHRSLVNSNWIRTAAWTGRSAILLACGTGPNT